ncbi:hypothetical protein QE152_g19404 [Popillia japonica]|uniref:Uncharacterized protein n=1 Tax=Popillia japonica TaxID=7064 RepID=A0AAW1KSK3_POPJA
MKGHQHFGSQPLNDVRVAYSDGKLASNSRQPLSSSTKSGFIGTSLDQMKGHQHFGSQPLNDVWVAYSDGKLASNSRQPLSSSLESSLIVSNEV